VKNKVSNPVENARKIVDCCVVGSVYYRLMQQSDSTTHNSREREEQVSI